MMGAGNSADAAAVGEIEEFARRIRIEALKMVNHAGASHIGSAFSIADIVACLYGRVMTMSFNDMAYEGRDRLILSKGHACTAIYAALAIKGAISLEDLRSYGDNESSLMNHISHHVTGVEFSTGSLGHGLGFGAGKAYAAKKKQEKWDTYVILSDGELGEGSNWEAFMFAAHHQLDNLYAVIDYNKLQSLTTIEKTLRIEPLADKLAAFGWNVLEADGNDVKAMLASFAAGQKETMRPTAIIAHTIKGKGVSYMENKVEWHYRTPKDDLFEQAMQELSK